MSAVLAIVLALAGAYLLTPVVRKLAIRAGVVDQPGERRVHERPTPRWGGLAIYIAFVTAAVVAVAVDPRVPFDAHVIGVLLAGSIVAVVGLLDDKYDLSAVVQFGAIILAGLLLTSFGIRIAFISNPFGPGLQWLYWLATPVTLMWVFGVTKIVDLMDGLDGLAAGICAIAAATLFIMSYQALSVRVFEIPGADHDYQVKVFTTVMIFSGALLGSSLGFLRFNYPPAGIFMGTIGAQFMGFIIASISMLGAFKVPALVAMAVPMLVLAIPILDTAFVVFRRALSGKRVYEADKSHVHHRLIERGLSHRQAIWVIYLLTICLSAVGLILFGFGK